MNAIILAAGLGSRLKHITKHKHKALIEVKNEPNLERTIKFLHEIGVYDIHIVVGYRADDFSYLKEKFGVNLIFNENFNTLNNLASFALALEFFGDSFVIDADVVMLQNILKIHEVSTYYTTKREKSKKKEWVVNSKNSHILSIEISERHAPSLLGISYFKKDDANIIKEQIKFLPKDAFSDLGLYWDSVAISLLDKIKVYEFVIDNSLVCELDDANDINELLKKIKHA